MGKLKPWFLRKRRKKESFFKYSISLLHLWLGLLSSIIIFIVCLTGSLYAFKQQIEDFIDRDFAYVETHKKRAASIDFIHSDFKEKFGEPTSITIYKEPDKSILVSSFSRNSPGTSAYYHPYSGAFLGTKSESSTSFFAFILDLHRFLLAGDIGKFVNGVAVLILVFMLFSGFIMWMPKRLKHMKQSLTIKLKARFYRVNYDLHKVIGFYCIPLLLFISITGLYVSFHWVKNVVIVGLGGDSIIISDTNLALKENLSNAFNIALNDLAENKTNSKEEVTIKQIIEKSENIYNHSGSILLHFPNEDVKNFTFTKMNKLYGLYVPDKIELANNGSIQKIISFKNLQLNEQFKAIVKPLHTGEIMGLPSIILYFFISLMGCLLPITGFIIWWKRVR